MASALTTVVRHLLVRSQLNKAWLSHHGFPIQIPPGCDNEIYDPKELQLLQGKMDAIISFKKRMVNFPQNAHIVLNIYGEEPEDTHCYGVNHEDRMIFFFVDFHSDWLATWGEVQGAYSRRHFRHELEAQYWKFVHLYPHSMNLSQSIIDELKDTLFFFNGDVTTSAYSTSPYNYTEINNLLSVLPLLEGQAQSGVSNAGRVEFIARIMFLICHNRFLNFYGEPCARIERDFSVYGDALFPRTLLLRSVSLFLFSAPDVHLNNLQKMWVDKMLHTAVWKDIMRKFSSEWQELVTFSTIMLNANVAFLAIQSVDTEPPSTRSWAQIFSYASTVANLACMILGLLLMRQNRTKRQETTDHVYEFLLSHDSEWTGLEALAIMFSLPYAALIWGMAAFFVAFALMCLKSSNRETHIVVISCLVLAAVYILWCIYLAWETNQKDTSQDNRSVAYSQNAELDMAEEEERIRAEEKKGDSDSGVTDTDVTSERQPSSHRLGHLPGVKTIRTLWNAFLCIFVPSSGSRQETERTSDSDIELGVLRSNANQLNLANAGNTRDITIPGQAETGNQSPPPLVHTT